MGITGNIRFNDVGHRKNFTLQVMELTEDGDMIKVRSYSVCPLHTIITNITIDINGGTKLSLR